jgi:hypothetical protein
MVMLPNGIMTIFGPVSALIHDVSGVLQMSQLNNFLFQIQQGKDFLYLAFGDGVYSAYNLNCKSSSCHQFASIWDTHILFLSKTFEATLLLSLQVMN